MTYLIPIGNGFMLFRKALQEKNQEQIKKWSDLIIQVFDHILIDSYKKKIKDSKSLTSVIFDFLHTQEADDIFDHTKIHAMISERVKDFQAAELLLQLK
jgi:hypothetical protein